jgi:hypothetical protein
MMNKTEGILWAALREILDPGAPWDDFEAALTVLERDQDWMVTALDERAGQIVSDLAPDRMSHLAKLLPDGASMPTFVQFCLETFRAERERSDGSAGILPVRRAHALAEVLARLGAFQKLDEEDLTWLFFQDEFATPRFYVSLAAWCEAHDPVPPAAVELVRALRADEDDSPILDRLAAWVAPSMQGMMDLAGWENGARRCFEPAWREAVSRWSECAETEAERVLLAESADPEGSANAETFQRAVARHRPTALRALDEARQSVECPPAWCVILAAWTDSLGGAS